MAYPEKELLEQHLVGHKIERRFICDICGAGLKRKEHLERHKLGHNPERPFVCSVCMKGFKRKEHLNLHFVIHSGEKTEICLECGKGFYRKDHLRKHTRSHVTRRAKVSFTTSVSIVLLSVIHCRSKPKGLKPFWKRAVPLRTSRPSWVLHYLMGRHTPRLPSKLVLEL